MKATTILTRVMERRNDGCSGLKEVKLKVEESVHLVQGCHEAGGRHGRTIPGIGKSVNLQLPSFDDATTQEVSSDQIEVQSSFDTATAQSSAHVGCAAVDSKVRCVVDSYTFPSPETKFFDLRTMSQ